MLDRYEQATVADLDPSLAGWDFSGGRGLLLYGPAGTGKTHAAVALWKRERMRPPTQFVSVARLLFEKKRQMNGPTEWKEPNWRSVRFVVLDDFDKARLTEWAREELFIIIDTLYCRRVPVIVTSNLSPSQFAKHVGPYVADRLKEMVVPVPMLGQSRRRMPDASHAEGRDGLSSPVGGDDAGAGDEPEQLAESDGAFARVGSAQDGVGRAGEALSEQERERAEGIVRVLVGHAARGVA